MTENYLQPQKWKQKKISSKSTNPAEFKPCSAHLRWDKQAHYPQANPAQVPPHILWLTKEDVNSYKLLPLLPIWISPPWGEGWKGQPGSLQIQPSYLS